MKSLLWKLASFILVAAFAVLAHAQSSITVTIPFAFVISDKTFPAGQYSVSSWQDKLAVQDSTRKTVFIGIANQVSGRPVRATGQLVFHCYDSTCFLSEFWTPVRDNGRWLPPSRYETELARHGKRTEFALLDQKR